MYFNRVGLPAINMHTSAANTTNSQIMMSLGDFVFSIDTAAYSQLTRTDAWQWVEQQRIGRQGKLQYTGKQSPSISLNGETHVYFRNGAGQIDKMRALADTATPQMMVIGTGQVMGYWVITELVDDTSSFMGAGVSKSQKFTMTLKYYGTSR